MDNAHLPNSDPRVTPDWKEQDFPRVSLLQAIKTERVRDLDGVYEGVVPEVWCARGGRRHAAHGGFCAAVLLSTACQYHRDKDPKLHDAQPLEIALQFLHPLNMGAFRVQLETLSLGKRSSTIQARLLSAESPEQICTVASVRVGSLKDEGHVHNIQPDEREFPNRNVCVRWIDAKYFYVNPATSMIRTFTPKDGYPPLWSEKYGGRNSRYQWFKQDDESNMQTEHIALLVDYIPAIPLNYENDGTKAAYRNSFPSIAMQIAFFSQVENEEWLATRASMSILQGGKFDVSIQVLDDAGRIVATCQHLFGMTPRTQKKLEVKL